MIKQVDFAFLQNAQEIPQNVFTTRIFANALAYEGVDFCRTYVLEHEGEILGAINLLGESACVWVSESSGEEMLTETEQFLAFLGANFVFTNAKSLVKSDLQQGKVLLKTALKKDSVSAQAYPDYKKAYEILCESFDMPDYLDFLSDLSHRVPKGLASVSLFDNAVGITNWHYRDACVISAIAVKDKCRHTGVGTDVIKSIIDTAKCEKIFVYTQEQTVPFYIKNGFEIIGNYYAGKVE